MKLTLDAIPKRRLLRTKQAAKHPSLSPWKLRQLIAYGQLPVVQAEEGAPFLLGHSRSGRLHRAQQEMQPFMISCNFLLSCLTLGKIINVAKKNPAAQALGQLGGK